MWWGAAPAGKPRMISVVQENQRAFLTGKRCLAVTASSAWR